MLDGQNFLGFLGKGSLRTKTGIHNQVDRDGNVFKFFEEDGDFFGIAANWIQKQTKDNCNTVILVGHSNGGDGARKVARQLERKGINVELLFLMDPVQKPWVLNGRGHLQTLSVSNNVKKTVSYYQRSDPRNILQPDPPSPLGQVRIGDRVIIPGVTMQGYQVSPGSNFLWTPPYSPADGPGPNSKPGNPIYAHSEMPFDPFIQGELGDAVQRVKENRSDP